MASAIAVIVRDRVIAVIGNPVGCPFCPDTYGGFKTYSYLRMRPVHNCAVFVCHPNDDKHVQRKI